MPVLAITTNVKVADPKAFLVEFSSFAAKSVGMDEGFVVTSYTHTENMTFSGSFGPSAVLDITLINPSLEQKEDLIKVFFQFFFEKLGVPPERGFIKFPKAGPEDMAWNAATFASIFKSQGL